MSVDAWLEMDYEDRMAPPLVEPAPEWDEMEAEEEWDEEDDYYPECAICGDPIDYCQGHSEREWSRIRTDW